MMRKSLYTVLIVCLLAMAPASVALAQKPEPPTLDLEATGDMPEALQQAAALQQSLTAEQHAAVRAILDKHLPDLEAASEALVATMGAAPDASMGKMSADADVATRAGPEAAAEPVDREAMARVQAVLQAIDADMAGVLDADQLALYRAVMNPALAAPDAAGPDAAGAPGSYTTNCYYGAYYNAYAETRAWLAYLYGYYDYYYYGYTYAYYTYYYAYYAYQYSVYALDYSAPLYFTYYFFNQYTSGYPYNAYYYGYYTEYYGYRAYYYGFYNYYYYGSGSAYGYYAYYYGYYAFYGGDYGHYYNYYCYYYS